MIRATRACRTIARYDAGAAYTQDAYRPIGEGMVPIQDAGFIHADAAYDVVSASRGYVFRMKDHIERFNESCRKFQLKNPYSDAADGRDHDEPREVRRPQRRVHVVGRHARADGRATARGRAT